MKKKVKIAPGMYNWIEVPDSLGACAHFGEPTGQTTTCPTCKGHVEVKLFECGIFGDCTPVKEVPGHACCNGTRGVDGKQVPCPHYTPRTDGHQALLDASRKSPEASPSPPKHSATLSWAYGVTTVLERRESLLPQTLLSLKRAGFESPRLFIDGSKPDAVWESLGLEVTYRWPRIRTAANWTLALWELYAREPQADRYAMFQDDFVTYPNLRAYLESVPYPEKGYLNLYTFPSEQSNAQGRKGFYESRQNGRGAVALIFNREAVVTLLSSRHLADRPQDAHRGHKAIDGGIVESMKKAGWKEYVHNPSLTQHVGDISSMGNKKHLKALSFQGESFDALNLLN
jgi:hypothetical protein